MNELNAFLNESPKENGIDRLNVIAVGYSNGANIAANLLFHYADVLKGAILHHSRGKRSDLSLEGVRRDEEIVGRHGPNDGSTLGNEWYETTVVK